MPGPTTSASSTARCVPFATLRPLIRDGHLRHGSPSTTSYPTWCCTIVRSRQPGSQHLEDAIYRPVGLAVTDADCNNSIEPVVLRSCGLKERSGAEIIACRVDHLTLVNSLHDVGRTVANPLIGHADQSVVLCFKDKANI